MKKNLEKKSWNRAAAAAVAGTLVLALLTGCQSKGSDSASGDVQKIKVGIMGASPLMSYTDDDGNFTGYEAETLKAIDEKLPQYEFEYIPTEFASLFVSLQAGDVDMISGNLRRSDEREENYIHTYRGYNSTPYRIIVLDTENDINGLDDLEGKRVAISQGSLQATILESYVEETGADIEAVYSTDPVGDYLSGRVDAMINPQFSYLIYNQSYDDVQFKNVGDELISEEGNGSDHNSYFWMAKGNEELRDAVSEAIYELRQDGTLSELSEKFFQEDRIPEIDEEQEEEQIKALGK
jgi:L-cystine transport system substrate-binding protein